MSNSDLTRAQKYFKIIVDNNGKHQRCNVHLSSSLEIKSTSFSPFSPAVSRFFFSLCLSMSSSSYDPC